jgi:ParB/RepB/Spo0J family partition protein
MKRANKEAFGKLKPVAVEEVHSASKPEFKFLEIKDIIPTPDNPRRIDTHSDGFQELAKSIMADGVKIPVVVRPHPELPGKYDLRAGARRLAASIEAGKTTIPALVYEEMTDADAFDMTFFENFARENLKPLEESAAVAMLLEKYGGNTQVVADKFDRSTRWVQMRAFVGKHLTSTWKAAIADEANDFYGWTIGHLELIARLSPVAQDSVYEEMDGSWNVAKLSVRDLKIHCDKYLRSLDSVKWDLGNSDMQTQDGQRLSSCSECIDQTNATPMLWEENYTINGGYCLNEDCWKAKEKIALMSQIQSAQKKHQNLKLISEYGDQEGFESIRSAVAGVLLPAQSSRLAPAKKTEENAVPCILVNGDKAGKIVYRKSIQEDQTQNSGPSAKPEKDRMDALYRKRWGWVLRELRDQLDKFNAGQFPDDQRKTILTTLAGTFGVDLHYPFHAWDEFWNVMESESLGDSIYESIWEGVIPNILKLIPIVEPTSKTSDNSIEACKHLAKLLGINIESLVAKAKKQIPTPKSWGIVENQEGGQDD